MDNWICTSEYKFLFNHDQSQIYSESQGIVNELVLGLNKETVRMGIISYIVSVALKASSHIASWCMRHKHVAISVDIACISLLKSTSIAHQ